MGPVPWALATADGLLVSTDEAKLMPAPELDNDFEKPRSDLCTSVIDGNALLQSLIGFPGTIGELAQRIFCVLPKSSRVDFITDAYQVTSLKTAERLGRENSFLFLYESLHRRGSVCDRF